MLTNKPNRPLDTHVGVWIGARNYDNPSAIENRGFWTGEEHRVFTIGSTGRVYYGVQGALEVPVIEYSRGSDIQTYRVALGPLRSEVQGFIKGFDLTFAPVQIHSFTFDPSTRVWTSEMLIDGEVDEMEETESEIDEYGNTMLSYSLSVVSNARLGTRTLSLRKSDASQRITNPNDGGRRYSDVSGDVQVVWMGDSKRSFRRDVADDRQR